jgi:hypothetical protein
LEEENDRSSNRKSPLGTEAGLKKLVPGANSSPSQSHPDLLNSPAQHEQDEDPLFVFANQNRVAPTIKNKDLGQSSPNDVVQEVFEASCDAC